MSEVLPVTDPEVATIDTVPRFRAVAAPLTVIDANVGCEELHVTVLVMSWVVPSENVPFALNCSMMPSGIVLVAGVTTIEVRVPLLTVSLAVAEIVPEDAVMIEAPACTA